MKITRAPEPRRTLRHHYKEGRGDIELTYFDSDRKPGQSPDLTNIGDTFERMLGFIEKNLKV